MRSLQVIVSLTCPGCSADLTGLDTDTLFGCDRCHLAYAPGLEGLVGPYPIQQHAEVERRGAPTLALPFWQLRLDPLLLPEGVLAPELVYVPAFDLRRRSYYGDPGQRWTQDRVQIPLGLQQRPLLGATLSLGDAEELARYYALGAVDRQKDVTGFDLDLHFSEPTVLLVDFADEGSALVDPITGDRIPSPAFCDLPAIRRGLERIGG